MSASGVATSFQAISGIPLAALRPTEARTSLRVFESSEYTRIVVFPPAPSCAAASASVCVKALVSLMASSVVDG